jgi:hypothetical protein
VTTSFADTRQEKKGALSSGKGKGGGGDINHTISPKDGAADRRRSHYPNPVRSGPRIPKNQAHGHVTRAQDGVSRKVILCLFVVFFLTVHNPSSHPTRSLGRNTARRWVLVVVNGWWWHWWRLMDGFGALKNLATFTLLHCRPGPHRAACSRSQQKNSINHGGKLSKQKASKQASKR